MTASDDHIKTIAGCNVDYSELRTQRRHRYGLIKQTKRITK